MANFTTEIIQKAKGAKSAKELFELAKTEGIDITEDEARKYFEQINLPDLDDELLDMVSGGAIGSEPIMNYNLVADKEVVRELVAADMTIENVKSELDKILIDGEERTTMLKEYDRMLEILGEAGASERAAGKIVGLLKNRG